MATNVSKSEEEFANFLRRKIFTDERYRELVREATCNPQQPMNWE